MKTFTFIAALLLSFNIFSQNPGQRYIDSLKSAIPVAVNDTVRARILNNLSIYYKDVNTDSALKYAEAGMKLTRKMKWLKGQGAFNTAFANIYATKGELDSALSMHLKALEIAEELEDSVNMAIIYNNLGTIANAKSDFVTAAKYYTNTLQIGKKLKNDFTTGLALENLALVFQYQEDYEKGLEYARESVSVYESANQENTLQSPLRLIGTFFLRLGKYDSAYYYLKRSLILSQKAGNKIQEATALTFLAECYSDQGDYNNAIKYGLDAKKIWDDASPQHEVAINNSGMVGYNYLQLAKQEKELTDPPGSKTINKEKLLQLAEKYLIDAVKRSRQENMKNSQMEFQHNLADANALAGNYKDAYLNYKSSVGIKDSLYSQENKNKIAAAISKYELDKRNAEIALSKLVIAQQRKQKIFYIVGLSLLAIIGGLLYWQSVSRKRTNTTLLQLNTELDEANKVKTKFFGILSHDLRSPIANLINFLQLQKRKPGIMSEEQIAERENKISGSAKSLLETMEAMLLWSKGQMEHFTPSITTVQVNKLFSYLRQFFAGTENIHFNYSSESDLMVETDENYLQTIMQNLTSNAIKAVRQTPNAKIDWKAWQENNRVYLSITDNGPGIANEQLKALYDQTAYRSTRQGLGLHIVSDMARAIGCTVSVQSQPGSGAVFILSI